jgi:hypothetical protein
LTGLANLFALAISKKSKKKTQKRGKQRCEKEFKRSIGETYWGEKILTSDFDALGSFGCWELKKTGSEK